MLKMHKILLVLSYGICITLSPYNFVLTLADDQVNLILHFFQVKMKAPQLHDL